MQLLAAHSPLGRLARLPLRLVPHGAVVRVMAGPGRGARWIVGSGPHGCWLGFNELRKRRVFEAAVGTDGVVYDVGANVGSYTVLAAKLVGPAGRVLAFEPVPANAAYLRRHVALNGASNVQLFEAAVVEREGTVEFGLNTDRLLGHVAPGGGLTVDGVSLDSVVASGNPLPTCLKIDVEGGEVGVLAGGAHVLGFIRPVVFVATHGHALHRRCLAALEACAYDVRAVRGCADELVAAPREASLSWMRSDDLAPVHRP